MVASSVVPFFSTLAGTGAAAVAVPVTAIWVAVTIGVAYVHARAPRGPAQWLLRILWAVLVGAGWGKVGRTACRFSGGLWAWVLQLLRRALKGSLWR
jgi:hypothetical protein